MGTIIVASALGLASFALGLMIFACARALRVNFRARRMRRTSTPLGFPGRGYNQMDGKHVAHDFPAVLR